MILDPGRVARSLNLHVEPLADGRYRVVGGTAEHRVERDARGWTCDCHDARFNGGVCKHRVARYLHERLDSRVLDALRSALGAA